MKKLFLVSLLALFLIGCVEETPDCELFNRGDVTLFNKGPFGTLESCYVKIDWSDGTSVTANFIVMKNFYNVAAGQANIYMEWEDYQYRYSSYGSFYVPQCGDVDVNCTYSK